MLWQGCSLSPRELERKAPRSVWATQLPASRPIRWIVRESREANRTDSPASHRTDFATHPARPRTDSPAFYRTNFARAPARQSDGLTFGIPSPAFPRTDSPALGRPTPIQPFPNPDMDGINRHSTILRVESKNDSDTTIPHPRSLNRQHRAARARLVHQLPWPSRHFLRHPRPEGDCEAAGTAAMSAATQNASRHEEASSARLDGRHPYSSREKHHGKYPHYRRRRYP